MFQVLEHIRNPVEFLSSCMCFLKNNGKIIIEVPNYNSYLKQCSTGYNSSHYMRGHLSYFKPELLHKTIQSAGYINVEVKGRQLYSAENAFHWVRHNMPFKEYPQIEVPEGLEFINESFKQKLENDLTSDMLLATGTKP